MPFGRPGLQKHVKKVLSTNCVDGVTDDDHIAEIFRQKFTFSGTQSLDSYGDLCDSDNYQGITVSCVISKLFEHCLMNKYDHYIYSRDVERLIFLIALLTALIF